MRVQKTSAIPVSIAGAILACGIILLFVSFLSHYFVPHLGHDQNSYLLEAQRMLAGAELYGPHLSETNPPLIIWFSAIPVAFAGWLHSSPVLLFKILLVGMVFFSVAWCVRILRHSPSVINPLAIGLLGCVILGIELGTGMMDFGQREHLLVILLVPYVIAVATGAINRLSTAERCALGVAAGLAIWFKPQHTLVLIGLELFLALRTRSLRRIFSPEILSLITTAFLLLGMVRLFAPLYMKQTYPILIDTYWALGTASPLGIALSIHFYLLYVLVALAIVFLQRRSLRVPATSAALLIASLFASFAFDIQRSAWDYHRYPHQALLLIALAYLFVDLLSPALDRLLSNPQQLRGIVFAGSAVSAIMLCAVAIHPGLAHFAHYEPDKDEVSQLFSQYQPGTTVYVFNSAVFSFSSAYVHHLNWGSRFIHLWMLPAIVQNELGPLSPTAPFKQLSPERVGQLSSIQRSESAEDLNYWKPSVVLVRHCTANDSCLGMDGKNFDMIGWFQQSPEFATAWSHYQKQPSGLHSYDIYKLVP